MDRGAAALLGLGTTPATSRGDIIFGLGGTSTTTNIGAYEQTSAQTATGQEIGGGPDLILIETNSELTVPAAGQARVEAADINNLFTAVFFEPFGAASAFSAIELNPQIDPGSGAEGTFTLTATDQFGNTSVSDVFDYGSGENRVFALGTEGQLITRLELNVLSGPGFLDIRQVRVTPIPEPSAVVLLGIGLGMVGLAGLRRRRDHLKTG
jgi:hypothetical protein